MKQEDKEVISGKSHFNKIRLEQLIAVSFPILPLNKLQPFTTFNFLHQEAQSRATDPFLSSLFYLQ